MIEITLYPALQTTFSTFTIKSKRNIESATDELIMTWECYVYISERVFHLKVNSTGLSFIMKIIYLAV